MAILCYSMVAVLLSSAVLASINVRRAGWLDRVVEYQKNKFFEDFKSLPPINLKARIEKAPPGYVDSRDWDYDSVMRLLTLIRDSEGAKPVRWVIRRMMLSSRRFMSFAQSIKAFPSLAKEHHNNFYYDVDSGEFYADVALNDTSKSDKLNEDDVIVVSNPVEARLPSARISVKLLKQILENRALAARPTTFSKKEIAWTTKKKKTTESKKCNKTTTTSTTTANSTQAHNTTTTTLNVTTSSPVPASNTTNTNQTTAAPPQTTPTVKN